MPGLLLSKLDPPPVRSQTLRRPDLLEQLDTATDRRLVIVAAPAGYGKTTLLSTWVTERAGDHRVCWLTLDEGDNDPTVLWSHLITALQRSCPELGDSVVPAAIGPGMLGDVVLPRLVNALAALPAVTVVLDDFHLLSSAASRDSVAWFLHHAPAVCHLVISTRTEPGLPLAALRAHGDLVEIRSNALRFTLTEGEDLLNRRLGLHLASPDVGRLVERTEGWPAGLYLAALSMGDAGGRHAFVAKFDASNRHVLDFLVDDVLVSYPPAMLEFMLRTSV